MGTFSCRFACSINKPTSHLVHLKFLRNPIAFLRYGGQCGSFFRTTPYKSVPSKAPTMATRIGEYPAPSVMNKGPGQAPVMAHPMPNTVPPNK